MFKIRFFVKTPNGTHAVYCYPHTDSNRVRADVTTALLGIRKLPDNLTPTNCSYVCTSSLMYRVQR